MATVAMVVPPNTKPRAPELWKKMAGVEIEVQYGLPVEVDFDALIIGSPYKSYVLNAYPSVILSEDVTRVGATNLIVRDVDATAYNTDVYGFRTAWEERFIPHDARTLVIGAGATGRAALYVLWSKVEKRWVINWTQARGIKTAVDFHANYVDAPIDWDVLRWFEVVVNTTPHAFSSYNVLSETHDQPLLALDIGTGGLFDQRMALHTHAKAMSLVLGGKPDTYLEKM